MFRRLACVAPSVWHVILTALALRFVVRVHQLNNSRSVNKGVGVEVKHFLDDGLWRADTIA